MQVKMFLKLLVLGGISIVMLIALGSIGGITRERKGRLRDVQCNIAESYAGRQRIIGPLVSVEFRESWTERSYNKEKNIWYDAERQAMKTRYLYPEQLNYEGSMQVQERYRGIFKAHVFQSTGQVSGSIAIPAREDFQTLENAKQEIVSARVCLLVSDPRGISRVPELMWNGSALKLKAGGGLPKGSPGIHAILPLEQLPFGESAAFSLDLNVHGMGQLEFVPLGSDNHVKLQSAWPHPSFIGDFLATTRTVTGDGFEAEWNINGLASTAQASMDNHQIEAIQHFGVNLIDPVNPYPLTDRALKYGFLFIFITFAAFFLFELVKQLKIHPIQYGFVGLAQAVFFLLLLSLSEHIGFGVSYLMAATVTVGLISFYLCNVLKGLRRGVFFGVMLGVLYAALYGLLQSEDYALAAGSLLLFGLLALIMVMTRRVDWYTLGRKTEGVVQ